MNDTGEKLSDVVERLVLSLAESGAVPIPELVRALERAAERLRGPSEPLDVPSDLVTQAEAARSMGVSRQAVNQWVQKGLVRAYPGSRNRSQVSLGEVAIAANKRSPPQLTAERRRELVDFFGLIHDPSIKTLTAETERSLLEESTQSYADEPRVLREFVIAAMDTGDRQREFTVEGAELLAALDPAFEVDLGTPFGRLADSLGLLVTSSGGRSGFDSAAGVVLGILGVATVGTRYPGAETDVAHAVAAAAQEVWGEVWLDRLYDAAYRLGETRPAPLARYTESLTYLDNHRFLRQAQPAGVSIAYSREPGPLVPERFYGSPIYLDILKGRRQEPAWAFTPASAEAAGRPADLASGNPFRVFAYEYGLLDSSVHGIRRYCFSSADVRAELRRATSRLTAQERTIYLRTAVDTLARTLALAHVELVAIDEGFNWWQEHIVRSSEREVLIGLHDKRARKVAHALLVQTNVLPSVVEAADSDESLRDRLRIYVKNLEFDVVDARYRDDLRRGVARIVKGGGVAVPRDEALRLAEAEINAHLS